MPQELTQKKAHDSDFRLQITAESQLVKLK